MAPPFGLTCAASSGGTCASTGTGNISDSVDLAVGATVTYALTATISAAATGTLVNTASIATPTGTTDPTPGNNSATDSDTLNRSVDLQITKTDLVTAAVPGGSVTYTIVAKNLGPSVVTGATVADTIPASLTLASWTCVASSGATCAASGTGSINDTVNLVVGATATYTLTATVVPTATGGLTNTATVATPTGTADRPQFDLGRRALIRACAAFA